MGIAKSAAPVAIAVKCGRFRAIGTENRNLRCNITVET